MMTVGEEIGADPRTKTIVIVVSVGEFTRGADASPNRLVSHP
jgi:hypothetical protein